MVNLTSGQLQERSTRDMELVELFGVFFLAFFSLSIHLSLTSPLRLSILLVVLYLLCLNFCSVGKSAIVLSLTLSRERIRAQSTANMLGFQSRMRERERGRKKGEKEKKISFQHRFLSEL